MNKEQELKYHKKYYQKNKKRMLRMNKENYWQNKDRVLKQQKKFYHEHKSEFKARFKTPHARFIYTKSLTKHDGRKFKLTEKQYVNIILKSCYYCNKSLQNEMGMGLDRIDNSKGYTLDNVLPCCGNCNKSRGGYHTVDTFKVMILAKQLYLKYRRKFKDFLLKYQDE